MKKKETRITFNCIHMYIYTLTMHIHITQSRDVLHHVRLVSFILGIIIKPGN